MIQWKVRPGRSVVHLAEAVVVVGLAGLPCIGQPASAPLVIATEGQPTPDGRYFRDIRAPELSLNGEVVFLAEVADHPSIGPSFVSIWRWRDGDLELIVGAARPQEGTRSPTPYTNFGSLPRTWPDGIVAYSAIVQTTPYNPDRASTVWLWDGDEHKIAQEDDAVPGLGLVRYDETFKLAALGQAGQLIFSSSLRGDGVSSENDVALLYHSNGVTEPLLRKGSEFSPAFPGVYAASDPVSSVSIDAQGRTLFHLALTGPNVELWTDQAIVMGTPNALDVILRRGDPIEGLGGGFVFGTFGYVSMNAQGHVLFSAHLNEPPNGTSRVGEAVWAGFPGNFVPMIRDGEGLIGLGRPVYKFLFLQQNDAGDLAFVCRLDPRDRYPSAIAVRKAGEPLPRALAAAGQQAPGTEQDSVFSEDSEPSTPFLTGLGNVAFLWSLEGPSIEDGNRTGLWATDVRGELRLVLRAGDDIDVSDSDTRTVRRVIPRVPRATGSQLDRVAGARGEMCFLVEYTDLTRSVVVVDLAPCLADFDGNGEVNTLDLLGFLNAFASGDPRADFDGNGNVNTLDVLFFLNEYPQPC
ncbi:hypothetical protein JYT82_00555 [bacterium AH-315-K20]|nr:hypothetical protein [bacterium AH-315-K20]